MYVITKERDFKDPGQGRKRNTKKAKEKAKTRLNYMEEKEWATIEDEIMELEMQIEEIDEKIIKAGSDYGEIGILYKDKTSLQENLDEKYKRWEYLSEFAD